MKKLTQIQKENILISYSMDNSKENINKLCNDYNISKQTIYNLVKSDLYKDIVKSTISENNNFTKRANEIIEKALDKIEEKILYDDKATLSQLSTTLGILYDKARLENNLSTSNSDIHINISIEK